MTAQVKLSTMPAGGLLFTLALFCIATAAQKTDIVQDGGFEAGSPNPAWEESADGPICSAASCDITPLQGDWSVAFGGAVAGSSDSWVQQTITLPSGGPRFLRFTVSSRAGEGTAYLRCLIDGAVAGELEYPPEPSHPVDKQDGKNTGESEIDLWAYADDQSHVLRFEGGNTSESGEGYLLLLDDVFVDTRSLCCGADWNCDHLISLSELLRAIQFFRSDGYHCDPAGEDGYNPGQGDQACAPYAMDYDPQDWFISVSELLRLIQFFNSGGYHRCEGTEDGYCPGSG